MIAKEARQFVGRFVNGVYDPGDYAAFLQWLEKDATIDELGNIADEYEGLFEKWSFPMVGPTAEWIGQLEEKLDRCDQKMEQAPVRRLHPAGIVRRRNWIAAASIVLLTAGAYLCYKSLEPVGPGASDGQVSGLSKEFSVPRGGQERQILLADGSKVWLNVASSLKYTEDGATRQRLVELSGEAYFDVAKKVGVPFRVKIKGAEIAVLGTQFNVKAYEEETLSKTTLVDGAIKVIRGEEEKILQPGDQVKMPYTSSEAGLRSEAGIKMAHGVNMENVLAWKNGDMEFEDDDLPTVMQEISRCYDLAVKFETGAPRGRFTGNLSRRSDIRQILNQLQHQNINVKLDGRTIVVMH